MRKKLIITFVGSSVLFSLPDIYYIVHRIGLKREALYGILTSLISGMFFGALLTIFIYIFLRVVKNKYGASNDLTQHGEIYIGGDINKIFLTSLSLLEKSDKFKTIKPFIEKNRIEMQTGISWQGLGEHIDIIFSSKDERVKVDITSKPRYKTTVVDYGKNAENVRLILSLLGQTS